MAATSPRRCDVNGSIVSRVPARPAAPGGGGVPEPARRHDAGARLLQRAAVDADRRCDERAALRIGRGPDQHRPVLARHRDLRAEIPVGAVYRPAPAALADAPVRPAPGLDAGDPLRLHGGDRGPRARRSGRRPGGGRPVRLSGGVRVRESGCRDRRLSHRNTGRGPVRPRRSLLRPGFPHRHVCLRSRWPRARGSVGLGRRARRHGRAAACRRHGHAVRAGACPRLGPGGGC